MVYKVPDDYWLRGWKIWDELKHNEFVDIQKEKENAQNLIQTNIPLTNQQPIWSATAAKTVFNKSALRNV